MGQPLFSIIMPVYNRAEKVGPSLQSIIDQTYEDWEAIIIDDGSDDGEELKAVVAALNDPRFSYIRRQNGGGSAARNTGIDAATGRFIAFLDSDDKFLGERLARSREIIDSERSGDLVIYSRYVIERGVGRQWTRPSRGHRPGERIDEYVMCTEGTVRTSAVTLSTSLAQRVRFDETLPSSQDTDFAVRCASSGAKFVFLPEVLMVYDDVPDMTRVSKQRDIRPLLAWLDRMRGVHISDRAYWGYRGWHCARLASYQSRLRGLKYYSSSVMRGVYPPKQAIRVASQVLIPPKTYQQIASLVVHLFGRDPAGVRNAS
jgi:glycosyltransferase involved in cell wall biosynthesis